MNKRKKVLAVLGVSSVLCASFAMLVYAAAWTPDEMAAYMQNVGRHKIYQTNWILYNEIGPKMGTGLVGTFSEGSVTPTALSNWATIWEIYPGGEPKKASVFVDLSEMDSGDTIWIYVMYWIKGNRVQIEDCISETGEETTTYVWLFQDDQFADGKIILDQFPIATHTEVIAMQTTGTLRTIHYQVILEEV